MPQSNAPGRIGKWAWRCLQLVALSALVLATRSANYADVFVNGEIYFTDADCYARMTRVRKCAEQPGLIVRHHEFENFPEGTSPHTTAPLDYLILGLSVLLRPLTARSVDLAGALISPLLALIGAWFLWWWSLRLGLVYRGLMLILYSVSPILVHGAELGRPDHQSLLLLLVMIAICAEWNLCLQPTRAWSVTAGLSWGFALWVSLYEPLILLIALYAATMLMGRLRAKLFEAPRRAGFVCLFLVVAIALLLERRLPSIPMFAADPLLANWSATIGELRPVSLWNPIWFHWLGWLLLALPVLVWLRCRQPSRMTDEEKPALVLGVLVALTFCLTIWQARWSYFFLLLVAISLPIWLRGGMPRAAVWIACLLAFFPLLRAWDEQLWPNDSLLAARVEKRREGVELRELAGVIRAGEVRGFLAPWWLSPAIAYWSGQPGVAGSSHESIGGIVASARFFASDDVWKPLDIVEHRRLEWVLSYDATRVAAASAAILGQPVSEHALCYVLDHGPVRAPRFVTLAAQNSTGKLFRVANNR